MKFVVGINSNIKQFYDQFMKSRICFKKRQTLPDESVIVCHHDMIIILVSKPRDNNENMISITVLFMK